MHTATIDILQITAHLLPSAPRRAPELESISSDERDGCARRAVDVRKIRRRRRSSRCFDDAIETATGGASVSLTAAAGSAGVTQWTQWHVGQPGGHSRSPFVAAVIGVLVEDTERHEQIRDHVPVARQLEAPDRDGEPRDEEPWQ